MNPLDQAIITERLIAVMRAPVYRDAAELARLALDAGVSVLEFTLTGENALEAIELAASVPGTVVGAGSVLDTEQASSAIDAGAAFLVAPVNLPEVAAASSIPTMLAGMTPTELHSAHVTTSWFVKLFPASVFGAESLKTIAGPLPDLRIVPSGGINPTNARAWLDAGAVAVASGWLCPSQTLISGDFQGTRSRALAFQQALSYPSSDLWHAKPGSDSKPERGVDP